MAISKVLQYNSTPTVVADYQAQNAHLQAMINKANGSMGILKQSSIATIPSISQGTYISMGGTLYVVDTSDYTILGTAIAGLNYIRLGVSGDNLTATWVQDISSYTWNSVYNYYTDGTYILLPYVVNFDTNYYVGTFHKMLSTLVLVDFINAGDILIEGKNDLIQDTFNSEKNIYFTALNDGEIRFKASVKARNDGSQYFGYPRIEIDATSIFAGYDSGEITNTTTWTDVSQDVSFKAGDTIKLKIYINTGGSVENFAYYRQIALLGDNSLSADFVRILQKDKIVYNN